MPADSPFAVEEPLKTNLGLSASARVRRCARRSFSVPSSSGRHYGGMRVLVVEDDELLASSLSRGLTAEGYAVEVAVDGVDGLHRAREFDYDAMILDVLLPGLNGVR